jgi:ferredoxin-nitrate reductase
VKKVARAPGQALSDFAIFKLVAQYWGCGPMFARWASPEAAFQLLKELSRDRPCDFTGIRDYAHIEAEGGIQWPFSAADAAEAGELRAQRSEVSSEKEAVSTARINGNGVYHSDPTVSLGFFEPPGLTPASSRGSSISRHRRLFADGKFFTPDGQARFFFDAPRPMPELPDREFPFILLTGRGSSAQWHTGSRTDKSAVLRKLAPTVLTVEINPFDAKRLKVAAGETVRVRSRRGALEAIAFVTPTVQPGQVFLPMHFAAVNLLTFPAFDPHSRQPSYKAAAVRIEWAGLA